MKSLKFFLIFTLKMLFCVLFALVVAAAHGDEEPFPSTTLKEVKFKGGLVGTSSNNEAQFGPDRAFQTTTGNNWHSGRDSESKGDQVVPFPHLIWYSFKAPFTPGRISFRPNQVSECGKNGYWCGATKWQFIGSNDEDCDQYSAWTILCEDLSGKHFERKTQSKYCTVDPSVKIKFKCLGISVLDASYPGYSCVSINGIRMWERVLQ